jgi:hypothetical protein
LWDEVVAEPDSQFPFCRQPEVIVGGAFVWRFCTRRLGAKLHIDAHPKLIANSPKWWNYEEKSRRVSAITSHETQTPTLQVKFSGDFS